MKKTYTLSTQTFSMKRAKPNQKTFSPKPSKQIARGSFKIDDKQLNKDLTEDTNNLYYFTHGVLEAVFNNEIDGHHTIQRKFKLTI